MKSQLPQYTPPTSLVGYRRVPEWQRQSNFRARVLAALVRGLLYLALIPAILSAGVVGASLELGSSWSEAFRNVKVVANATIETYRTHFSLVTMSAHILLSLESDEAPDDLDMIAYVAEIRSKTSELSASIDRTLADYLKRQVELSKQRRQLGEQANRPVDNSAPTLTSVAYAGLLAALVPLLIYWLLGYMLTRWWLSVRARETVEFHQARVLRAQNRKEKKEKARTEKSSSGEFAPPLVKLPDEQQAYEPVSSLFDQEMGVAEAPSLIDPYEISTPSSIPPKKYPESKSE